MHNLSLDDLEIQDFFKEEESNGVQVSWNKVLLTIFTEPISILKDGQSRL